MSNAASPAATAASPVPTDSHTKLEQLVARMQRDDGFPAVAGSVSRVLAMTSDDNEDLRRLTDQILRDPGLTQRLLRIANSAPYVAHRGGVATVSRAISLLGVGAVRAIALSIVLLDHWGTRERARRLKDLFAQSLLAAEWAAELCGSASGREEVLIAALFQGMGRMLVECFLPDLADQIRTEAQGQPARESAAVRRHLGVTYDELAQHVASLWGFPPELVRVMARPQGPAPAHAPRDTVEWVRWTAAAGHDLAEGWLRAIEAENGELMQAVARRYHGLLGRRSEEIADAGRRVRDTFVATAEALQLLPENGGSVWAAFRDPAQQDPLRPAPRLTAKSGGSGGALRPVGHTVAADAGAAGPGGVTATLARGIEDLSSALLEASTREALATLALEVLACALRGGRALLCAHNDGGILKPVAAMGAGVEPLQAVFQVPMTVTDPAVGGDLFAVLARLGRDSWIDDLSAGKLQQRLPAWYHPLQPPGGKLLVLPLTRADEVVGLVYVDDPQVGAAALTEIDRRLLRAFKQMIVWALSAATVSAPGRERAA